MRPYLTCLLGLCIALLGGCTIIDPTVIERPFTRALYDAADTRLAKRYAPSMAEHPGLSGFRLIDSGLEALSRRLQLVDQAQKTIDLQYYILRSDLSGLLLIDHLLAAADRGVRVRILIDDLHYDQSGTPLDSLDTHPHVELRSINPFLYRHSLLPGRLFEIFSDFSRVQRRMHNKLFIVDNTVALIGGRNLGDEYFEAHPRLDLRDIDLLAVGPVVPQLSGSFDAYWNFKQSLPVSALSKRTTGHKPLKALRQVLNDHKQRADVIDYLQHLAKHEAARAPLTWAPSRLLADLPCKLVPDQADCASLHFDGIYDLFKQAESELLIISPYFIPGKQGIELFQQLRQNRIRVKVLTNSYAATDLKIVQAGYNRYRRRLLTEQVDVYEFKPTFPPPFTQRKKPSAFAGASQACMHAKAYVLDRKRVFVGSFNHDPRSASLNTEIGILVESPELATQLAALFARYTQPPNSYRLRLEPWKKGRQRLAWQTEEDGEKRTYHQEPLTTWWQHLKNALLAVFAPEDLL